MDELLEEYKEQFSEHNWAHHIVSNINVFHSPQSNVNLILKTGIKKEPLKTVITFLKNKFSLKYIKATEILSNKNNLTKFELADQIVKFVLLSVPHVCLKCSTSYVPYLQDNYDAAVSCFMCEIPCHMECYTEDAVNEDTGIVLLCHHCITLKGTVYLGRENKLTNTQEVSESDAESDLLTPAQKNPKEQPEESSRESSDSNSEPSTPVKKKTKNIKKKSKRRSSSPSKSTSSDTSSDESDDGKKKPLCKFFENSRCKHGISGKDCKFRHEKVCRRFMNYGKHKQHGCNKGRNCEYFHPKMCWESLNNQTCSREKCKFSHIKGTQRKTPTQDSQSNQNKVNVWQSSQATNHKPPTSHENNEESFLEIAKKLSQQIDQIQIQQNVMMSRFQNLNLDHNHQLQHHLSNLLIPPHQSSATQQANHQPTAPPLFPTVVRPPTAT